MRKLLIAIVILALLAAAGFVSMPPALVNEAQAPALPDDLDAYIAERERSAGAEFPLIPSTEKRIRWYDKREQTSYSIVNLHGFSGSRQGVAPLAERVAEALGANLFETRLAGHGRASGAMVGVMAEDWLDDGAEALAIGAALGERVILIGTSTGATLAIAMADQPGFEFVDTLIMISPNFAPIDPASRWITRPGGPLLLRAMVGETRSWQAHNAGQKRYWSTSYPSAILVEVMRLVDLAHSVLPLQTDRSILTFMSPNDQVVSPQAIIEALRRVDAPRTSVVEFEAVGDPHNHVLAGDILSPGNTDEVVIRIVEFIRDADSAY